MKNTKLPSIISILILTAITSVVWVSLSIYWSFKATPAPSVPKEISEPLTPTLNRNVMSDIEGKLFFNDSEIPQLNLTQKVGATPIETPVATPTPTASESATPVATESGTPTP